MTSKTKKKASIDAIAAEFQKLDREVKKIQSLQKPLKQALIKHAEEHKSTFDAAFQLKFPCGTYISLRVSDALQGTGEAKTALLTDAAEYADVSINEKLLLADAPNNPHLRKLLTKHGLEITQKEVLAIYAG